MKILFVMQYAFGNKLGVTKVHYDLKKEYERLNHTVDILDSSKFYPHGKSSFSKLIDPCITKLIHRELRKIASNYDVIDANYECIPYAKSTFGFKGLLVFRSHGLPPVYRKYENSAAYKSMLARGPIQNPSLKSRLGGFYRSLERKPGEKEFSQSMKCADLIHCLNSTEKQYLLDSGIKEEKIIQISNGIPDEFIKMATNSRLPTGAEVAKNISLLASWTARKGIYDINEIFGKLRQDLDYNSLKILGSHVGKKEVHKILYHQLQGGVVEPSFDPKELPQLLSDCRAGIFPSYIEGFGLSVVEQLACGVPVVAYNVPGPADILKELDGRLLVRPGDIDGMAEQIRWIMNMPSKEYLALQNKCRVHSARFRVSEVAKTFIENYERGLLSL